MRRRLISLSGVVAALALVAGCGTQTQAGTPAPAPSSSAPNGSPGSAPGQAGGRACPGPPASAPGPVLAMARTPQLAGVQFVSGSDGWVVGSDRILRTTDAGGHWSVQYSTTARAELTSVDFTDASHGWVVGASKLLATTDGGAHWTTLPEPCEVVRSVHFVSPEVGFAVAGGAAPYLGVTPSGGVLLRTSDGGRHWRLLTTPADVQTVCLRDASHGWLGAGGSLYGTADGGRTWTRAVSGPARSGQVGDAVVAEVQCAASETAWAVLIGPGAAMNQEPHVGYHFDGTTWRPIFSEHYFPQRGLHVSASAPGPKAGPFSAISAQDAVFIDWCAPCSSPATPQLQGTAPMAVATEGGASLTARGAVSQLTQANGAAFVSVEDGWVVGTQTTYPASGGAPTSVSKIMHTTDGGRSWQAQYLLGP